MSTQRVSSVGHLKFWVLGTAMLAALLALTGCRHEKPGFTFMPDMSYSPAIKAQAEGSMRVPAPNTIPRGYKPYPFHGQPEEAGRRLRNPLPRSLAVLNNGRVLYNAYCLACHGPGGEGDGPVTQAPSGNSFPRPPSLVSEKIRDFPDGRLFHIISDGQNLMPSYASQVDVEERWAIAHYIRVLHRAKNPTPDDLRLLEKW